MTALLWARKAARAAANANDQQTAQLLHQQKQWELQYEGQIALQAEHVAAWIEFEDGPLPDGRSSVSAAEMTGTYYICLQNDSNLPVFEVTVAIKPPLHGEVVQSIFWPVLRPNSGIEKHSFATNSHMRSWRCEVRFRDSRNQCWRRDHFGVLAKDEWEPHNWDFADAAEGGERPDAAGAESAMPGVDVR